VREEEAKTTPDLNSAQKTEKFNTRPTAAHQQHNSNSSATVTPTPATKQQQTDKATAGKSITLSFTVRIPQRRQLTGGKLVP
jgi:hypothetical protein